MMKRKNEVNAIELFAVLANDKVVDSANLDILDEFDAIAANDVELEDYDPEVFALVMATVLTAQDVEFWDNDGDILKLYRRKKAEVFTAMKGA